MPLQKEICKIFIKLLDKNIYSTFFPKLINRNSIIMNKNNYRVSKDFAYIFVHIPKTGGMSINCIISKINNQLKDTKIYQGGHNLISILHSTSEKKYISVIRDPIERAYSFYQTSLKDKKQPYNYLAKKSLSHFITYCPEAQNIFCKYYSGEIDKDINSDLFNRAVENVKNFYQIFDFQNFENDITKFLKTLGIQNVELPHLNKSYHKKNITDDERKIIEFYNYYDLKLYEFIKSKKN